MKHPRPLRLLIALALVAGATIGLASGASAAVAQVDVLDFRYSPANLTVTEGDTIVFRWRGEDSHTVTAFDESFDSGVKYAGDDYALTFESPGEYAYFCIIHGPQMSGVVRVMPEDGTLVTPATDDNVAEAIAWSQVAVPDGGAPIALLGRDDLFGDSLASGGVQGRLGAPLLLNPTGDLDARVVDELERMGTGSVIILGGEAAISAEVESDLRAAGFSVDRVAGTDRVDTAVQLAQRYFATTDEAILVRARGSGTQAFADSLGAGALAAKLGVPVLLTPTGALSALTKSYLEDAGVSTVHIAGGTAAVSQDVEDELTDAGFAVNRLGGATRFETNAMLASTGFGGFVQPEQVVAVIDGTGTNRDAWVSGFASALLVSDRGALIVANGADVDPRYFSALVEDNPAVVCGPDTDACAGVVNAASVDGQFEAGSLHAVANTPTGTEAEGQRAVLDLRPAADPGTACWLTVNGSLDTPIVASHIHRVSDNVAVFGTGAIAPGAQFTYGCGAESSEGDLAAILADPSAYYWNIHFDGHGETVQGDVIQTSDVLIAFGDGSQEVPGPGHPSGVTFSLFGVDANNDDVICAAILSFVFGETGPVPITGAHIHDGPAGVAGPVVVALDPPPAGNLVGGGCVDTDDAALVADIAANPNEYYLNLHTDEHPAGAVRGQLIDLLPAFSTPEVVS